MEQDIRWEQRFSNYIKALHKLDKAVEYIQENISEENDSIADTDLDDVLDEMIKEGLIQRFEYTFELACNVMKDYAAFQGSQNVNGTRDAIREAYSLNLIADGKLWMEMIISRNKTSHTYNETTAEEIYTKILTEYYPAFVDFQSTMEEKRNGKQTDLFNG